MVSLIGALCSDLWERLQPRMLCLPSRYFTNAFQALRLLTICV